MSLHDEEDPLAVLARGNPLPTDVVPQTDSDTIHRVFALVVARVARSHRRRRTLKAISVVVAALATIAAIAYFSRAPTQVNGIACYSAPTLEADFFVVAPTTGGVGRADDCSPLWADGSVTNPDFDASVGVPDLLGCVSSDGRLLVFPSLEVGLCNRLGLAEVAEEINVAPDQTTVTDALVNLFGSGECIAFDVARSLIEELLQSVEGGGTWVLNVGTATENRPCASYQIDGEVRVVTLIPVPPPPPGE